MIEKENIQLLNVILCHRVKSFIIHVTFSELRGTSSEGLGTLEGCPLVSLYWRCRTVVPLDEDPVADPRPTGETLSHSWLENVWGFPVAA